VPTLANAKHEIFAQELAKGKTQAEAHALAGLSPNDGHAARTAARADVKARVAELLAVVAERAIVTIHDIADQLDEDRLFAREQEAPAAAIQATMGKAKVLGLLTEKVEHTGKDGGPIEMADTELARLIVFQLQKAQKASE
jgi:phage terminase small subunit